MPTIKKQWTSQTWIEGDGTPTWTTLSGTTEEFSSDVDMDTNGYEAAHVQIYTDFQTSPNGDIEVAFYGSLDGSTYDTIPFHKITIDNAADLNDLSFMISGYNHFRLGFVNTNGSDTGNKVRAAHKSWNYISG